MDGRECKEAASGQLHDAHLAGCEPLRGVCVYAAVSSLSPLITTSHDGNLHDHAYQVMSERESRRLDQTSLVLAL